jgi:hypothetical protein
MGAFEGIGLVIAGAVLTWIFEMTSDRGKNLASERSKLRDRVAELDKTNSLAIATLTSGIEHIVDGLDGIRGDMREHREVVFRRLDRNEGEIRDVKDMVSRSNFQLQAIQLRLGEGEE